MNRYKLHLLAGSLFLCLGLTRAGAAPTALPPAQSANPNTPSISGQLFSVTPQTDLTTLKTTQAAVTRAAGDGAAISVAFVKGDNVYPNVRFPCPVGGWNLSAFGGVKIDLTNTGSSDVNAGLRVDNLGDWHLSPWNQAGVHLAPGETKTLAVVFGQSAYVLDPSHVVAIQVFLDHPAQNAALTIRNLVAYGSPPPRVDAGALSTPADRGKPVTLPAWLGARPPVPGAWVRTLNENFDEPTLNDKLWSTQTWWNGLIGDQTQRYSKDNLVLDHGILKIKCERRPGPEYDDPKLPSRDYTTGLMISYDKWTQRYGYVEARMKLPTARGLWPAFWMMPDRGVGAGPEGWKRESTKDGGMEIDILEHLTEWGPGRYNVAAHWDGYDVDHKSWGSADTYYGPTADGWHVWGVLWEPAKITWYCDGTKKASFVSDRVGSVPMYLIFNVQMGGWATKDVDEAHLPDALQVDYVRAWQLKSRMQK